ncbi:MAG: exodeoxyribonuclease VII large subunit [Pseudomonadota bacterium]
MSWAEPAYNRGMDDPTSTNLAEVSVSELAASLKRTIETRFDHVRVRGELGRVTLARSGHMYADIKDDKAVLNTVMWKGQVAQLSFRPEEGLEVVAEGKLSIYAGRSNYQLLASSMRPAGAGALMALLEERKKKLAAEGLFAAEHKKDLPAYPKTIGVVTSPTGAVIRDILHRIRDRYPVRVIVWPALVQGDLAAAQIEVGIRGFNAIQAGNRPDLLIVGRGGGSIEDLWPFNEESVVRAAFESRIPLISAVGHETDTTLLDYVADARAPTPTGAAELAVPVRRDLLVQANEYGARLARGLTRCVARDGDRLKSARMPRRETLLERPRQRLDYASTALPRSLSLVTGQARTRFERIGLSLPSPRSLTETKHQRLNLIALSLKNGLARGVSAKRLAVSEITGGLRTSPLIRETKAARRALTQAARRARPALNRLGEARRNRLAAAVKLLSALSHKSVLERGFALVTTAKGELVRSSQAAQAAPDLWLNFTDGEIAVRTNAEEKPRSRRPHRPSKTSAGGNKKTAKRVDQPDLF